MVLEPVLSNRRADDPFRMWIIGCSTGEEAYSIAMLLLEVLDSAPATEIEIVATDVDPSSIELARRGAYGPRIARAISPERLERFFIREGSGYRVDEHVRERILFSTHDPLLHPPFPDLDLVVCRNLLDSLKPAPRREVLSRLRDGLKPGGSLLLGPAENRPVPFSYFSVLEARQRLFVRTAFVRTAYDERTSRGEHNGQGEHLGSTSQLQAVNESLRSKLEGLAAVNADLKTLLGKTRVAILLDPDLRIRSFTRATSDLFRIVEADRGRRIDELPRRFAHDDLAGVILRGRDAPGGVEDAVLGDDGRWFAMRTLAHRTAAGTIAGSVLTFVDITARKSAEELLVRSREFVASVAHELREPLHVIIGYADILCEEGSEPHPHMLSEIRRTASGLLELMSALLELSRLDHTRPSASVESVPVSSLIERSSKRSRWVPGNAGPRIRSRLAADLPGLFTDH
jgi:signal transduction histidine kinase